MNMSDPRMRGFRRRAEVQEVERFVSERVKPLPGEALVTQEAGGRVLREAVASSLDIPPFDRSAMDGFALRAEETFGATPYAAMDVRVVGSALPGQPFAGVVESGEAVRIMTGAPIPTGADAVVKVEETRPGPDDRTVQVCGAVSPGKNISRRGEDIRRGATVLAPGRVLRPQDIGVLSSIGVTEVTVHRRPRVDIVVTGAELLPAGSRPEGFRIVDSNSPMLRHLVMRDGGTPVGHPIVEDDLESIKAALSSCGGEVILVGGGSSVGEEDHVPAAVQALGELVFHGIAMRPSSPAGVGFMGERPVFLLPGNPVSCLCAYDFFAGPAIRVLGGRSPAWPYRTCHLPMARRLSSEVGRVDYARVCIVDGRVEPLMVSGASILSSATRADGVVIVPGPVEGYEAAEAVTVHLYD